jgi:hypothetical protein
VGVTDGGVKVCYFDLIIHLNGHFQLLNAFWAQITRSLLDVENWLALKCSLLASAASCAPLSCHFDRVLNGILSIANAMSVKVPQAAKRLG